MKSLIKVVEESLKVAKRFIEHTRFFLGLVLLADAFSAFGLEVHFLRHGETAWNRAKVLQGSIPYTDLTARGVRMAEETASGMEAAGVRYDRIYASSLLRAYHTAEIVAKAQGLTPIVDERICEMGMGRYEGQRYVKGEYPDENLKNFFEGTGPYIPTGKGAESMDDVAVRLKSFLNEVIAPLEGKADKVLCVAHSFVLKTLVREFADENASEDAKKPIQRNCCVHVLECKNGRFSVKETGRIYYNAADFESAPEPIMVAHRGAGDRTSFRPEASLAAYSNAVATACDVVKFDLQCTRDNVIVMGHCPNLKRTMGWDANIKDLDYAEIYEKGRYLEAKKKQGPQRIVRLEEAIAVCRSIPQFWIDFKYFDPDFVDNVFKTFAAAGIDRSRLMVATFSVPALEYIKEKHPDIRRIRHTQWWQASEFRFRVHGEDNYFKTRQEAMAHIVTRSKELGLYGLNIPVEKVTPEDIAFFRKGGLKWISLFFVQNADTAAKVRSWGMDAFVTDYVTKARAGLDREKVTDFDVKAYGAKGDGVTKDTAAIQKAIDAANAAGGGTVRIGAGTFLSGSIYLKSNVELFLDRGATLKGSPDKEDYNKADVCVQNASSKLESASGAHLVLCIEQTNVAIRGYGRIDGNCGAFIIGPDGKNWPGGQSKIPWRPSQMVYFVECENVSVEGVSLIDSSYWSCFIHGCTNVKVKNLLVRTRREPVHTHNGDGVDIDSCQDVEISDCDIDTADDCITLRANTARLKTKRPCERIRVSNCRLSSPCNAVRIGVGDGVVRDAVLKNLEIYDTRTAVSMVSSWRKGGKGVDFKDITFDGMKVECRNFCRIYPRYSRTAKLEGIRFVNVKGTTTVPAWVWGYTENPVSDVTFENVDIPNGICAVNVKSLNIIGGTLKRNALTKAEEAKYIREIEEAIDYPGSVKIGGTVRGSMAHGGDVKMPVRGLCAHQGDMQFFPGNTAEALHSAVKKGAAMVEFDVQRCEYGEFVLMHDTTVNRLTTGNGRVKDHSLELLKSMKFKSPNGKKCRIPTFDEALDVIPDGGILINVHCYAGRSEMANIVRKLKDRGRLHQAFVCSGLGDIAAARKAFPEVVANNIDRPGPRNRDWTDKECAKFVSDSKRHKCQYLQLSRPWDRKYSDAAHEAGVKVIHFFSDRPEQLKDLMDVRGIDFVMTNRIGPMNEEFKKLGLSIY